MMTIDEGRAELGSRIAASSATFGCSPGSAPSSARSRRCTSKTDVVPYVRTTICHSLTSICRVRAQTENENVLEVVMFCSTARARVMEATMFCAMQVRGLLCAAHSGG